MSPKSLSARLKTISKSWQFDVLHPQYQLSTFLTSLASHPKLTPEAVKAAEALSDNAAMRKFPLPEKLASPASMPLYYTRLLDGIEKSKQGIGRPWWKVFFNIW
ncbi:hypothetical protein M422DRAFT_274496 [Sphaerobolus stellatus SS14]|uniref:Uncharacterized protein n=1 Tax=Sphaerobolus stellatus (strain SS14) TaxID=990650 RepID=A0A0C9U6A8_SPHS4|nr:hypothetical protein M422DRAFT_274496 [Sphaerobolus stellatus SS14]